MSRQSYPHLTYKLSRSSSQTKVSSCSRSLSQKKKILQNPQLADLQEYKSHQKAHNKISKKVSLKEPQKVKSEQNIKSTLKVTQTTSSSNVFCYALIVWLILFLLTMSISIYSKVQQSWQLASLQKRQCQQDFVKNRCEKPFKDLINYCQQKKICMNSSLEDIFIKNLKISHTLGEVMNQFIQGAGFWVITIGLAILTLGMVFGRTHSVTKQFTQYY